MNRNNKAVGQHKFCAILGTPIGVTKIEHHTEIGAVEQNRAAKAEARQKCGAISGVSKSGVSKSGVSKSGAQYPSGSSQAKDHKRKLPANIQQI